MQDCIESSCKHACHFAQHYPDIIYRAYIHTYIIHPSDTYHKYKIYRTLDPIQIALVQRGRRPENSSGRIVPELFSGRCFLEGTDPPQCDIIIEEKPIKSKSLNDNIAEHMKSTIDSF